MLSCHYEFYFVVVQSVVCDSLLPHGLQPARLPCPSLSPRVCSNSCPLSRWCHPATSSSVTLFSSCLQSFPVSNSFHVSQFFASSGQSIGASASAAVLPMSIQGWFPLGLTCVISLQSKGLSRTFIPLITFDMLRIFVIVSQGVSWSLLPPTHH